MQELDGIATLRMSGARATFTLKEGEAFEEHAVAATLARREMQLASFARQDTPRAQTMRRYLVTPPAHGGPLWS